MKGGGGGGGGGGRAVGGGVVGGGGRGGGGGGMGLSLFPRGILRSGGTSVKFRFTKKPCLLALKN